MYNLINVQYSFGTIVIVFHKGQLNLSPWKQYPQVKFLKKTLDKQYNCKQIFMPPFKSPLYMPHSEVGCGGSGPLIVFSYLVVCNFHATKNPLYFIVIWSCGGDIMEVVHQ
jgi:hypothetical protein